MNIKQIFLCLSFTFVSNMLIASENNPILCRLAQKDDAQKIVDLIATYLPKDKETVIIYPKQFRLEMIIKAIEKQHMFIALKENHIVGFKEIYLIRTQHELNETLDELGYLNNKQTIDTKILKPEDQYKKPLSTSYNYIPNINNLTINLNLDFTHPHYRHQKINTQLAKYAFQYMQPQVKEWAQQHNSRKITLIYGLSELNDWNITENDKSDASLKKQSRTPNIAQSFAQFIQDIKFSEKAPDLNLERVITYMPTFDENATTCEPVSQDKWPLSSGNTLTYSIEDNK